MDINLLFRSGMRECGRVLKVLPKDEIGTPMDYMMTILKEETIPSLNIIYPRLFQATFNINELIQVNDPTDIEKYGLSNKYIAYRIPHKLTEGLDIMSIKSCVPSVYRTNRGDQMNELTSFGTLTGDDSWNWVNRYGRASSASLYEMAARAQLDYADRQLLGQFTNAFRYKFYPPNILCILTEYATNSLSLDVTFCLKNDDNLISIEDTAYEEVRKLFILDLKKSIYNEYGLFSSVSTPNGDIDLKIDDWSSAEGDRNELYNQHLSTAHFRTTGMRSG